MSDDLPQGWARIPLNQATAFVPTGVLIFNGEVDYYSTGSIQDDAAVPEGRFTFKSRPSRANRWSREGDVMQARMQGTNKGILIRKRLADRLFSTGFLQLRADANVCEPRFVAHYVRSTEFLSTRDEFATGSTQIALTDMGAKELTIPLAPVAEQRRIVAKLEKLLGKVDACRQRLAKIPVLLKRFRQSVLAAACSGRMTADWHENNRCDDFESATVGTIADYIGGFAYKSATFLKTGKHQVIRIGNVRPLALKLDASPVYVPDQIAEQTQRFKLEPGDIAISMTGTKYKQDYGFAALVTDSDGTLFLNQRVARIRCGKSVLPKFLLFWLQTDLFREFFFSGETGNVNQGNVGAGGIRNAPIELPLLVEQQEIVRRVERLFALADHIEARYAKAKAHVEKLTQSILAKAFRGELVPQDPNDEPASVLLERIRQQRNRTKENNHYGKAKTKRTNSSRNRRSASR